MILVCAAGLHGSNADDVGKEIGDLPRAQVGADRDRRRGRGALPRRARDAQRAGRAPRPVVRALHDGRPSVRLRGGARHRRDGASAARSTRPHRSARQFWSRRRRAYSACSPARCRPCADRFFDSLRTSSYDGALDAGTAVRFASLLRYATGVVPLDVYQVEFGKVGTPSTLIEDLNAALTKAIEELTRPIDAIKHQAKTVTVGISRSDETLLQVPLVQELLTTGAPRDSLTYRALRTRGRARSRGRRGRRLDPLPHRRRREPFRRHHRSRRHGRHRARHPVAHGRQPDPARYQAPRRERTGGDRRARPRRRSDARHHPRDQGQPGDRSHAVARALPRPAAGRSRPPRRSRATETGTRPSPTRSPKSSRSCATTSSRRSISSSCSPNRSCNSPTAGGRSASDTMTDASMRAWTVAEPAPIDTGPLRQVARRRPATPARRSARPRAGVRRVPHRSPPRRGRSRAASIPASCPATKWSARSMHSARTRSASSSATASASPGCATRAGSANGAAAVPRTCVSCPRSRAGTPTAATRRGRWSTSVTPTRCPTRTTMCTRRRCCVRASSGTAP